MIHRDSFTWFATGWDTAAAVEMAVSSQGCVCTTDMQNANPTRIRKKQTHPNEACVATKLGLISVDMWNTHKTRADRSTENPILTF